MKTIIVATNYSASSNNAIKYAGTLARQTNSKIVLFNSFELSVHAANTLLPASAIDELVAINRTRLKDIAFNVSNTFGVIVESLARRSDLKEELDYQVERLKADLVVVGMGEKYLDPWYENTATSILRHSKYPVLGVPEEASFEGISKILFAFDPDCMHAANKLAMLTEVAEFFNAQVEVYHVEERKRSLVTTPDHTSHAAFDVDTLLNEITHSYKDVEETDVVDGIEREIQNNNADLLVMVPHKYGLWQGLWHKSKTGKMACRTRIPLLSLPNPDNA